MKNEQSFIEFEVERQIEQLIKVIGVGGAGSNAVNHMYLHQKLDNVNYIVCNTDSQALAASPVPTKIQIGKTLTGGLGAGSKKETGRQAALENLEDIEEALGDKTKMLFITAGMGGGTGTGAAPEIAKLAKEKGILTLAIVTMPFLYEGEKRRKQAVEGIRTLRQHVDSLIVVENEKLVELYGDLGFTEAFAKSNEVLSNAVRSVITVITKNYLINLDFNDVESILKDSGTALFGLAEANGENRAKIVASKTLESPLLNNNNIRGAKKVLLLIRSGDETATVGEISYINNYVREAAGNDVDLFMGLGVDHELGDKISVTVIATGFPENVQKEHISEKVPLIKHLPSDAEQELDPSLKRFSNNELFTPAEKRPPASPVSKEKNQKEKDEYDEDWERYREYKNRQKQNKNKSGKSPKDKNQRNTNNSGELSLFDLEPGQNPDQDKDNDQDNGDHQPTARTNDLTSAETLNISREETHVVKIFDQEEDDMNVERYAALHEEKQTVQNISKRQYENTAQQAEKFTLEEIRPKTDLSYLSKYNFHFDKVNPEELKKKHFIRLHEDGTFDLNDSHSYINRKLD